MRKYTLSFEIQKEQQNFLVGGDDKLNSSRSATIPQIEDRIWISRIASAGPTRG